MSIISDIIPGLRIAMPHCGWAVPLWWILRSCLWQFHFRRSDGIAVSSFSFVSWISRTSISSSSAVFARISALERRPQTLACSILSLFGRLGFFAGSLVDSLGPDGAAIVLPFFPSSIFGSLDGTIVYNSCTSPTTFVWWPAFCRFRMGTLADPVSALRRLPISTGAPDLQAWMGGCEKTRVAIS